MSERKRIISNLFEGILKFLEKKDNGDYIFKNNKYQFSSSTNFGRYLNDEELSNIPSIEELCDYFEKEILPIVPHATLFVNDNLSITVNIEKNPILLKKIYLAKKELDIYESLKTLFFPTMKEFVAKFGNSKPEIIYSPARKYKVEIYDIKKNGKSYGIRFASHRLKSMRSIDKAAIDFLLEDINYSISNLKFQNPIDSYTAKLPQKDVTREELLAISERKRKGFHLLEFYSYEQKINFIKSLYEDFLEYYPYLVENNFPRIKHAFSLFNKLPIRITLYTEKFFDSFSNEEDVGYDYVFEELPKDSQSEVVLRENQKHSNKKGEYVISGSTMFSSLLNITIFGSFYFRMSFTSPQFYNPYIAQRNALPFTYRHIKEELDLILEKIQSDAIFDEIKPFISHIDSWVRMILEAEKRGNEDYYLELKLIPTESKKKNGSGNDIYSEINAFENKEGGYLFIGVDEDKKGFEKIVGLEGYFRDKKKNLDMVKREIDDKSIKYLGKTFQIDADLFGGKTLIRIKVVPNYGNISWFKPEKGDKCAYIRDNGKKRKLEIDEIIGRLTGSGLTS